MAVTKAPCGTNASAASLPVTFARPVVFFRLSTKLLRHPTGAYRNNRFCVRGGRDFPGSVKNKKMRQALTTATECRPRPLKPPNFQHAYVIGDGQWHEVSRRWSASSTLHKPEARSGGRTPWVANSTVSTVAVTFRTRAHGVFAHYNSPRNLRAPRQRSWMRVSTVKRRHCEPALSTHAATEDTAAAATSRTRKARVVMLVSCRVGTTLAVRSLRSACTGSLAGLVLYSDPLPIVDTPL